jgi:hypothetical protein
MGFCRKSVRRCYYLTSDKACPDLPACPPTSDAFFFFCDGIGAVVGGQVRDLEINNNSVKMSVSGGTFTLATHAEFSFAQTVRIRVCTCNLNVFLGKEDSLLHFECLIFFRVDLEYARCVTLATIVDRGVPGWLAPADRS